jgi:hypothetical protein
MADTALLDAGSDDVDGPQPYQFVVQRLEARGINTIVVRQQNAHAIHIEG